MSRPEIASKVRPAGVMSVVVTVTATVADEFARTLLLEAVGEAVGSIEATVPAIGVDDMTWATA